MLQLSIVLPCYNPPQDWHLQVITSYQAISKDLGFEPELIIVNDGSTQNIKPEFEYLKGLVNNIKLISLQENQGKGAALRQGVQHTNGNWVIYTDIDFPYTKDSFLQIFHALENGNDVAIGIKDNSYYAHLPKMRKYISKILRQGIRSFFKMPITDTQCGLKGFNQKGKSIFLSTTINRYLFDLEFVYLTFRKENNCKVIAREVSLRPNVIFRAMNLRILLSESKNFFKILNQPKIKHSEK